MKGRHWIAVAALALAAALAPIAALGGETSPARISEAEIADLFSQGKESFRLANELSGSDPAAAHDLYRKAALRFERIAGEGGIDNGKLYYNIGNAYFRMQDLGRAILNYRRAELFIPNDANLQQNLAYALQRRKDAIEVETQTKVLHTLFFWHYEVPARARAWLFAAAFTGAWGAAALLLFVQRSALKWLAGILAVCAVACLASLLVEAGAQETARRGVIIAESAVARKGDSESYEPSFQDALHAGTEFQMLEDRGDWLNVALADGRSCWLPRADVELVR